MHGVSAAALKRRDVTFGRESFGSFWCSAQDAMRQHWAEVAKDKTLLQLKLDADYYEKIERNGSLLVVIARHAGLLAGYMLLTLSTHPHYADVMVAQDDSHFLLPEYRRGLNGYLLIKVAMQFAKAAGAQYCYVREKVGHEHPAMMKRLGLRELDVTYSCNLTQWSGR